ncbi:hypothetical protein [Myxococcus sp. CA040A]|uniref:hypothetical protein n=1 Tax=Myxococcus sp. CA040A TaxID=2741738 RepID=UPI001C2DF021|nr:hypothetical protein [Myxococcus sp. CA040A]NTX01965.1 hypothetical protein [Myxococcus sp. CA040A]
MYRCMQAVFATVLCIPLACGSPEANHQDAPQQTGSEEKALTDPYNPLPEGIRWFQGARFASGENETASYLHPEAHSGYTSTLNGCPPEFDDIGYSLFGYNFTWTIAGTTVDMGGVCKINHTFPTQGAYDVRLTITHSELLGGGPIETAQYQRFVTIRDYLVVSLGDSYGSGEGAPDAAAHWGDTDTHPVWQNARCHRSFKSPAARAALALESSDPHSSVTFLSLACSGATIQRTTYEYENWGGNFPLGIFDGFATASDGPPRGSGILGPYVGIEAPAYQHGAWNPEHYMPSQLNRLVTLVGNRPIDALVLSAGGNDVGFGDILRFCVVHTDCHQGNDGQELRSKVDVLKAALPTSYDLLQTQLKQVGLDVRSTYLMEYPDFARGNSGQICSSILEETNLYAGVGADVSYGELAYLDGYVRLPLMNMMQDAAERHGWNYVSGISDAFAGVGSGVGHGLCASPSNRWVNNGYDASSTQGPEDSEAETTGTAHPNETGYAVMTVFLQEKMDDTLPPLPRVGILKTQGEAHVQEGGAASGWVPQSGDIQAVALSGSRIGVLKLNGDFYLKDGALTAMWNLVTGDVAAIALSGDRIGIIKTNGEAYVKEGAWNASWVLMSGDVKALSLSGKRIGMLKLNGDFYLKDGALTALWDLVTGDVAAIALSGKRIGVVKTNTESYVKEGAWNAIWVALGSNSKAIALTENRVGVLRLNGEFFLRDGALTTAWNLVTGDVQSISLAGRRIGIVKTDGNGYVKEGAWTGLWNWETTATTQLVLATP